MQSEEIQQYYLRSIASDLMGWGDPQKKLANAFLHDEFVLYGQSIVKLASQANDRARTEIFVRLKEEEQNLIPPGTFLPILEYHNLGPTLDRYVLRKALVWCSTNGPKPGCVIHINLCYGTLTDLDFPAFVVTELKATGLRGDGLCFEIPQLNRPYGSTTLEFVKKLKAAQCHMAVGVVEAGNISFQPAKEISADFVKVDGSLTREIATDKGAAAKLRALTRACQAFRIQIIAQHVEDQRTLDILSEMGVDYAQGYGVSEHGPLATSAQA